MSGMTCISFCAVGFFKIVKQCFESGILKELLCVCFFQFFTEQKRGEEEGGGGHIHVYCKKVMLN